MSNGLGGNQGEDYSKKQEAAPWLEGNQRIQNSKASTAPSSIMATDPRVKVGGLHSSALFRQSDFCTPCPNMPSMPARAQRIVREMADVAKDKASGITVVPFVHDNYMHLKGTFNGPEGVWFPSACYPADLRQWPTRQLATSWTAGITLADD